MYVFMSNANLCVGGFISIHMNQIQIVRVNINDIEKTIEGMVQRTNWRMESLEKMGRFNRHGLPLLAL